jgi:thiamine pyrophosphokinase
MRYFRGEQRKMREEAGCVFVIAGGPMGSPDFFRAQAARYSPIEFICADSGARHLFALGMTPRVIIGDMDSLPEEDLQRFAKGNCLIRRYPREKKETDTQLALEYAWQLLPQEVRIYGALGGRIDHTLANISLLAAKTGKGIPTTLVDEWCEVSVISESTVLEGMVGQTVSFFPLAAPALGINLEGFAYPLAGGRMEVGAPYGISNLLAANRAVVSVATGRLLMVKYHQPDCFPPGN